MIVQSFDIEGYWKVVVCYNVDYSLFDVIYDELRYWGASDEQVDRIYRRMSQGGAKSVTYSNLDRHACVVLFNRHSSRSDYINSLVHEAEHIKQAMLEAYDVEDAGEPPAYTIGYLVMRMWEVFRLIY